MRFLEKDLFFNMYECFPCMHVHVPYVPGSQKRVLAPLELELKMVVSHHALVGTELGSSATTASALNH